MGIEPGNSGVGDNKSANRTTTTTHCCHYPCQRVDRQLIHDAKLVRLLINLTSTLEANYLQEGAAASKRCGLEGHGFESRCRRVSAVKYNLLTLSCVFKCEM